MELVPVGTRWCSTFLSALRKQKQNHLADLQAGAAPSPPTQRPLLACWRNYVSQRALKRPEEDAEGGKEEGTMKTSKRADGC